MLATSKSFRWEDPLNVLHLGSITWIQVDPSGSTKSLNPSGWSCSALDETRPSPPHQLGIHHPFPMIHITDIPQLVTWMNHVSEPVETRWHMLMKQFFPTQAKTRWSGRNWEATVHVAGPAHCGKYSPCHWFQDQPILKSASDHRSFLHMRSSRRIFFCQLSWQPCAFLALHINHIKVDAQFISTADSPWNRP